VTFQHIRLEQSRPAYAAIIIARPGRLNALAYVASEAALPRFEGR
jgi:hypothetical protein